MATWRTRAQQLVDLENDDSIADAVWSWFASMVYAELWTEVSTTGRRYFETSTTVTATGADSYDEPEGHMGTVLVTRVSGDYEYPLRELRPGEEAAYKGTTGEAAAWALVDDQLYLYPNPSSGTYKWYYQQQPTDLSSYADGDIVDVVLPAGEAFFLWGIGLLALQRQQKNVQLAMTEKEKARERLQFEAAQRNAREVMQREPDDDDGPAPGQWGWGWRP
jgi:hypothetical protein